MAGKMIIFSAPSGAGKTTIVKEIMHRISNLSFSVSATNRPKRENETNGIDYYFFDKRTFLEKIDNDEFLEWEEVYKGSCYGTLRKEVEKSLKEGKNIIFDIDVQGGMNIKKVFNDLAFSIFIMPPSIEILKERLFSRSTDSAKDIETRIEKARFEMQFAEHFDLILINDNLDKAIAKAESEIKKFLQE